MNRDDFEEYLGAIIDTGTESEKRIVRKFKSYLDEYRDQSNRLLFDKTCEGEAKDRLLGEVGILFALCDFLDDILSLERK